MSYFNIHENKNKNPHYFLSEELLVPRCQSCDTQRVNMFSNHLTQMVHLKDPEVPKVFTNFENQFGAPSIAHKEAEADFVVIDKIYKNQYNYVMIIQYKESKKFDVIQVSNCRNISESYGYKLHDCMENIAVGDEVKAGTQLYRSHDYDDAGNYAYGRNLRAVFLATHNMTYEDGIVISESGAKKLTSYKVEKIEVSVNTNDLMLNLYGENGKYKSFLKIGDHTKNKVLLAMRRIDHGKSLYDLNDKMLCEIDPVNDDIVYTEGGEVVDIDYYCNIPLEQLKQRQNEFTKELIKEIEDQYDYYNQLAKALEKIIPIRPKTQEEIQRASKPGVRGEKPAHVPVAPIPTAENPNKYSDDLAYLWKVAHEYIDEKIKWREDGKSFENVKIQFTILKENPLLEGCKITGRYGNKGIISQILPDHMMPYCETTGQYAEICLNPLGVLNRLNIAQIQEQHINFMSDHLVKWMHDESPTLQEKEEKFFKYLFILNKNQHDFLREKYDSLDVAGKIRFFSDIMQDGIYIHQYPFFGNPGMEDFKKIFVEMPELCTEYQFIDIERPLVMGEMYFIRLKHESTNKNSIRSSSQTNIRNLPAKNTLKKEKKSLYSTTPIRLGEMEATNLMVTKHPELVEKFFKYYSTSEDDRTDLIEKLLTEEDPLNLELQQPKDKSANRQMLDKYLEILDLKLEDSEN